MSPQSVMEFPFISFLKYWVFSVVHSRLMFNVSTKTLSNWIISCYYILIIGRQNADGSFKDVLKYTHMFSLNSSPNCTNTIPLASVQSSCAGMKKDQKHCPAIFPCHPYHNKNTNILWKRSGGLPNAVLHSSKLRMTRLSALFLKVTHYRTV